MKKKKRPETATKYVMILMLAVFSFSTGYFLRLALNANKWWFFLLYMIMMILSSFLVLIMTGAYHVILRKEFA